MTGARGASTRIRLVKEIIRSHLIDFQQKATEQTNTEANRNVDLAWLCAERNIRERGEDYLRGSLGLESIEKIDPALLGLHREGFGVLAEVYDHGSQVLRICHGDLSTADVLEDREGPRRIWFTDPKLKIRDPVFDVATVLSSPGTRLSKKWDNLFRQFRVCLLDNTRDSYLKTLPFTTTKTEFFRERLFDPSSSMTRYDESQMLGFGTVVGLVNSYRNLARISDLERIFPEEYERTVEGRPALVEAKREMALNIKRALRRLIEEPEKYNITQGTARGADNLLNNVFIQTGIIQSQNEKDLRYFFDVTNPQSALQYLHGLKQKFEKSRTEEQRRISEEALGILDEYGEGTDFDTFRRFFQQQGEPDGSRPRIQPDRRLGFKIPRDKAPA